MLMDMKELRPKLEALTRRDLKWIYRHDKAYLRSPQFEAEVQEVVDLTLEDEHLRKTAISMVVTSDV